MTAIDDGPLFDAIRAIKKAGKTQTGLTQAEVDRVKAILAEMLSPPVEPNASSEGPAEGATAPKKPITALALAMGIAAAAITVPFVSGWEDGPQGPALKPYRDIVGVWTQCSGETLNVTANSPTETSEGCAIKLDTRLAGFARDVAACTPSLKGRDAQWAAATSLAYNIGDQRLLPFDRRSPLRCR